MTGRRTARWLVAILFVLAADPVRAQQPVRDFDMFVGSSVPGGGQLALAHDFCQAVLVTPGLSAGGVTRWTSTQPGFNDLGRDRSDVFQLRANTPVSMQLVSLDPGVSLKLGAALLDAPGASALIGNAPNLHVHPEWRLGLPDGQGGAFHVEFTLTTGSGHYGESPAYRFTLTTDPATRQLCNSEDPEVPLPDPTVDHLLPGRLLVLRGTPTNPARKALRLEFAGPFDASAPSDPTAGGGRLRVLSNSGDTFEGRYELPAARWRPRRKRGAVVGWRFADPRGPVRRVLVTFGKSVRVIGNGSALQHSIGQRPDPIDVALTLGQTRACLRFGGATTFKPGKLFEAADAGAPDLCAP